MTRKEFVRRLRQTAKRANGYINPLPEEPDSELDAAERKLGFALPPILRYIYKHAGEDFFSLSYSVEQYLKWLPASEPKAANSWPEKLLPLSDEGDSIWLCLDCKHRSVPVLRYRGDFGPDSPDEECFEHVSPSFVEYLRAFISREEGGYCAE